MANYEIDIFNTNPEDISNTIYNIPVKLILKKDSYRIWKNKLFINKHRATIYFENVVFNSEVSIHLDEGIDDYEISLNFRNCFIDSFRANLLESSKVRIFISNCISDNFVSDTPLLKSIDINNSFGTYFISNSNKVNISFTEDNIRVRDWYKKNSLDTIISYKTSFYLKDIKQVLFSGKQVVGERKVELLKFHKSFYFDWLSKRNDKNGLRLLLSDEQKRKLNISLDLKYTLGFGHIKTIIQNMILNSLSISGKSESEITIEDCSIENIYLRKFLPKSDFTLYNINSLNPKGKFEVHNSNLDNTWFNSVNLNNYFVVFHKSSFINAKFSSTVFPSIKELLDSNTFSSVENIHYPDEIKNPTSFNRNMYELFLELKQAFQKRGNSFEAKKMQAVAHEFLYKIEDWRINKSDFWNNKFVLGVNRLSNFHGISIRNAFFFSFLTILLFHTLNIISFKSVEFGYQNWEDFTGIINSNIHYIFSIANPTHRISSIAPSKELTGCTYMISFFSRIFVGFSFYQFIAAFRRFGK